jgi:hypothetical protein
MLYNRETGSESNHDYNGSFFVILFCDFFSGLTALLWRHFRDWPAGSLRV